MNKRTTARSTRTKPATKASPAKSRARKSGATRPHLPSKHRINIFLDIAILEHFKAKAGGRGYQTLINEALKQAMQAEKLEALVRRTIREELRKE
jgi:uncharacterized protein (DUF4415 family)